MDDSIHHFSVHEHLLNAIAVTDGVCAFGTPRCPKHHEPHGPLADLKRGNSHKSNA